MITCVVESCFEHLVLLTMTPTSIPSTSSREQMPRPVPSPMTKQLLASWSDSVLVVAQLEHIRSSCVLVSTCALTQHSYAVPASNPLIWILVVVALMLCTFTSWIWPSDSADVVHDKSYPLMVLLLGIDCSTCCTRYGLTCSIIHHRYASNIPYVLVMVYTNSSLS